VPAVSAGTPFFFWGIGIAQADVAFSSHPSHRIACSRLSPHMDSLGWSELHTAGLSGCPNILQRWSSSSWMQRTPAAFPCGMPGIGLEMDGAVQQAPHPGRHAIAAGSGKSAGISGIGNAEDIPPLSAQVTPDAVPPKIEGPLQDPSSRLATPARPDSPARHAPRSGRDGTDHAP
jgi:hypothetical protein